MTGGPLSGLRVVDVSALAPGPFCTQILVDFGADVIWVEPIEPPPFDVASFFAPGKRSILVDLRRPEGAAAVARLTATADVFVEGSRPGTMERLGLGPDKLCAANPRLIYTRLTGWGQTGPYAKQAGHDINYLAVGGALGVLGGSPPRPPLNLVGDFASGSVMAAFGTVMAVLDRHRTGVGQVVDAAMLDGAAQLIAAQLAEFNRGRWRTGGGNLLDGSAPFYRCYTCADGRFLAVGAIEPKFYAAFLGGVGADSALAAVQFDETTWTATSETIAALVARRTRDEWIEAFTGIDACVSPVLELDELASDPHLADRGTVSKGAAGVETAPAPRLSAAPSAASRPPATARGAHTRSVLAEAGLSPTEIDELLASGAVAAG